jgi:hypothetical protein
VNIPDTHLKKSKGKDVAKKRDRMKETFIYHNKKNQELVSNALDVASTQGTTLSHWGEIFYKKAIYWEETDKMSGNSDCGV